MSTDESTAQNPYEQVEETLGDLATFDFNDVLEGDSYPTDTVSVYLNEDVAVRLGRVRNAITAVSLNAELTPEERTEEIVKLEEFEKQYEEALKASTYVFHLRGVRSELILNAEAEAEAKYPTKTKIVFDPRTHERVDQVQPNPKKFIYLSAIMNALYVTKIVDSKGRVDTAPGPDTLEKFMGKAPHSQLKKLQAAIKGLEGASEYFEDSMSAEFFQNS